MKIFRDVFIEWIDSEIGKQADDPEPLVSRKMILRLVRAKLDEVIEEEHAKFVKEKTSHA